MFFLKIDRKHYSMESRNYEKEEALMKIIFQSALRVHSALGPGLLESVYEIWWRDRNLFQLNVMI